MEKLKKQTLCSRISERHMFEKNQLKICGIGNAAIHRPMPLDNKREMKIVFNPSEFYSSTVPTFVVSL